MNTQRAATLGSLLACTLLAVPPVSAEEKDPKGFVRVTPEQVHWQSPFGMGIKIATIEGDPSKPGVYVQRVTFPPGMFSRPHFHSDERHVVVIKGTWYTGTTPTFDLSQAVPLKTGSYMKHPAGAVHWDGAKDEEVIVHIMGQGPSTTTQVDPNQESLFISAK